MVEYHMNRFDITCFSIYGGLGILVTSSLSWSTHIYKICTRAQPYALYHQEKYSSQFVYNAEKKDVSSVSMVTLILCFSTVATLFNERCKKKLESVQQRATMFILQDFSADYEARLISLTLLPVSMWLELQDVV